MLFVLNLLGFWFVASWAVNIAIAAYAGRGTRYASLHPLQRRLILLWVLPFFTVEVCLRWALGVDDPGDVGEVWQAWLFIFFLGKDPT